MFIDLFGFELKHKDIQYLNDLEEALILQYTEEYERAQANLDYVGMNAAAKKAAELRAEKYPRYDKYIDTYDYTHGGMFDIYSNGSEDYYSNGYPEEVYLLTNNQLENVFDNWEKTFTSKHTNVKNPNIYFLEETLNTAALYFVDNKTLRKKTVVDIYVDIPTIIAKSAYNSLKYKESQSVKSGSAYVGEFLNSPFASQYSYYVYILEGSTSSEIKIASVYDGNILFENSFDLHQSESSSLLRSFAQQYGKLVASNCRPHTYTYRKE